MTHSSHLLGPAQRELRPFPNLNSYYTPSPWLHPPCSFCISLKLGSSSPGIFTACSLTSTRHFTQFILLLLRPSLATHSNPCPYQQFYPLPSVLSVFTPFNTLYTLYSYNTFLPPPEHRVQESWSLLPCGVFCVWHTREALSNRVSKWLSNLTEYLAVSTF